MKYSQKTLHSSPERARYGVSFVSSKGNILWRLVKIELYKIFAIINRAIKGLHCILTHFYVCFHVITGPLIKLQVADQLTCFSEKKTMFSFLSEHLRLVNTRDSGDRGRHKPNQYARICPCTESDLKRCRQHRLNSDSAPAHSGMFTA